MEFGLHSFADVTVGTDGRPLAHAQVIRNVISQAVLADQVGVDFFGIGEHHQAEFAASAPDMLLACIAGRTGRIRLGSAVTVLSLDDPVRVFQRFATLDAMADGRAELVVGRGSFAESFALFGQQMSDYKTLFEEKLDLFVSLVRRGAVPPRTDGRPPSGAAVFPPVERGSLQVWVGVGASPESVLRAARHDLPLMLAVIGGEPQRFLPLLELYRSAFDRLGRKVRPIGVHSPGHVAASDSQAREELWPAYRAVRDRIGAGRGWPPLSRASFELEADRGSLFVGAPQTVARRIASTVRALGLSRFAMKFSAGTLPHEQLLGSIELYGRQVAPMVRDMLA